MSDVARELAKHFDAAALSRARVRFDGDELPCVAPDSLAGFVEAVSFAARDGLALVPTGLGSKLGWTRPPERADFLLSTRRYAGVISHVPDDGTIALRAGTTMADARRVAREGGHWLTPDVPHPERKTLGGVIAAGESGADRLRFGPLRHHVLGLVVVLADGSVAKCGGQLVKNVTGFDLMRLYTGSHGTLCVIVEAALRLFPEPEHELWIEAHTALDAEAFELAHRALALPVRCASVSIGSNARGNFIAARLCGRRDVVASERQQILAVWPKATVHDGRAACEARRDAFAPGSRPSLRVGCAPSRMRELHAELETLLERDSSRCEPGLATLEVELAESLRHVPAHVAEIVAALHRRREEIALANLPSAELARCAAHEPEAPGLELMRALKAQLDPRGVLARGRFVGGL